MYEKESRGRENVLSIFLFLAPSHPSNTPPFPSVQLFSQWESELSGAVSWQLLFMSLSQRHTLSEGETPMLPDLLSTVKDPVWLEGRQRSGHSFTVHSTVLFSQRQSNLTLIILGRHFSFALGIPAVLYNTKHIPISNQPLQSCLDNVAVNTSVTCGCCFFSSFPN